MVAPTAPGVSRERPVERLRRQAVRDVQLGVELRGDERRAQPGRGRSASMVLECALRWTHHLAARGAPG